MAELTKGQLDEIEAQLPGLVFTGVGLLLVKALHETVAMARRTLAAEAENLELTGALLDVINQTCQVRFVDGRCIVDPLHSSAYIGALELLERLGIVKKVHGWKRRWELMWDTLPDRGSNRPKVQPL